MPMVMGVQNLLRKYQAMKGCEGLMLTKLTDHVTTTLVNEKNYAYDEADCVLTIMCQSAG
jgi:hypothetical protein